MHYPDIDQTLPFSFLEPFCRFLLAPLSWGYALLVCVRAWLYRANLIRVIEAGVPVISVGNLTTGGTGKTPMVVSIVQALQQRGKKVVVLSRGYGASKSIDYAQATDPAYGDEAAMMQAGLPETTVIVGSNRSANALRAVREYQPDVIVLDDGFQHWRLHRQIDIVLIDAQKLLGNGLLLPAGPLREPKAALKRASVVLVTKIKSSEVIPLVESWVPTIPVVPISFQTIGLFAPGAQEATVPSALQDLPIIAICGIAHPDQFVSSLHAHGVGVDQMLRFSDHYAYTMDEVENWLSAFPKGHFVTTEKDWVKLKKLWPVHDRERISVLKIAPYFDSAWFYDKFLAPVFAS